MTYVVTEACIKCKHMDCVEVCPVDCFYVGENMLVIHPDQCIDCGVASLSARRRPLCLTAISGARLGGTQPDLRAAMAEHHAQGRTTGGCR